VLQGSRRQMHGILLNSLAEEQRGCMRACRRGVVATAPTAAEIAGSSALPLPISLQHLFALEAIRGGNNLPPLVHCMVPSALLDAK